ncbi:hypothetical protein ACFRMN_04245 [Streptomyces sp. NPDC056835]
MTDVKDAEQAGVGTLVADKRDNRVIAGSCGFVIGVAVSATTQ